jgi:hypothetical protein
LPERGWAFDAKLRKIPGKGPVLLRSKLFLKLVVLTLLISSCQPPELLEPVAPPSVLASASERIVTIPSPLPTQSPSSRQEPLLAPSVLASSLPELIPSVIPGPSLIPSVKPSEIPIPTPRASPKPTAPVSPQPSSTSRVDLNQNIAHLTQAYQNKQSHLQIQSAGLVSRLLADDLDGSRHQRFILRLSSGQTLLIAHNIDLASGIVNLKVGDAVEFYGEYEWNLEGGVIHWTHRDPQNKHEAGWLKHQGQIYQ